MEEKNLTKCKECGNIKMRHMVGKYDLRNKKYADEQGKLWSGLTCPSCHKEKQKEAQRVRRSNKKQGHSTENE